MTARELIRSARHRAGLTQRELARRLGTKQPVIARWELGHREPDFEAVVRALRACGFELSTDLVERDIQEEVLLSEWLAMTPLERLQANENLLETERWAHRARVIGRRGGHP